MTEEKEPHCLTCYCDDTDFLLESMKTDQLTIKKIEKALWAIEANNVVRMSGLEWQIKQEEKENEDS